MNGSGQRALSGARDGLSPCRMAPDMSIKLDKDAEKRLIESIKRFFAETLEEEVGDLRASLVLDFCLKEIGPSIYNQAVADAQAILQERVADLDGSCFQPEHAYWDKK